MLFDKTLLWAGLLLWASWIMRAGVVAAQMFQIEEYEPPRFLTWCLRRPWLAMRAVQVGAALLVISIIIGIPLPVSLRLTVWRVGFAGALVCLHLLWRWPTAKKPLVYTLRMRRILSASAGATLIVALLFGLGLSVFPAPLQSVLLLLAVALAPLMTALLVLAGNVAMSPVEALIRQSFLRKARERVANVAPKVVAVAGSYGKTSTKHIAAQLLSHQIETLATPKSFNTLMGVTRTINENLEDKHKLFIVEMDAYGPGEIRVMARLVAPTVGIVTSVGPQHLERFGTVAKIEDALFELPEELPDQGTALIYAGDPLSAQLASRARQLSRRVLCYGMEGETDTGLDIVASAVTFIGEMTRFVWRWEAEGFCIPVTIPLLGKHNVLNTSVALALVHLLGLSVEQAARDAEKLEFVQHRLQLIKGAGGVTVIDDSYNANPVGVRNGLEVLKQLPGRQKILVTPGLVELGSLQEQENHHYGELAAQACHWVILVGPEQTKSIRDGLQSAGFDASRIHIVRTLDEVTTLLGQISRPGDVILFANDLPDTYLE